MLELLDAIKINFSLPTLTLGQKKQDLFLSQGFILAKDYFIKRPLPLFDNSAMDGYALNFDTQQLPLKCTRTILAGQDASQITIKENEAIKIMTGAMIPQNANVVVPLEQAYLKDTILQIPKPLPLFANIRKKGEEKKENTLLASKGSLLDFDTIGLLASQGIRKIDVYQKPIIGVFSNGSEIKEAGNQALSHQIYDINAPSIMAILQKYHQECHYLGILPDNIVLEKQILKAASTYQILITSGGTSAGDTDLLEKVLLQNNAQIFYHRINVKPGKPLMIAKLNDCFIFCLPGNPTSGIIHLLTLLIPTIFYLSNAQTYYPKPVYAKLSDDLLFKGNRTNIILGNVAQGIFTPYNHGIYSPNAISAFTNANSFLIVGPDTKKIIAGSIVATLPYFVELTKNYQNYINSFNFIDN